MQFHMQQLMPNQNFPQQPKTDLLKDFYCLYVGDLPKDFYTLDLYKLFDSSGFAIKKCKSIVDKNNGKSLGFGYIYFYTKEEAERAIKEMNNK